MKIWLNVYTTTVEGPFTSQHLADAHALTDRKGRVKLDIETMTSRWDCEDTDDL